MKTVMALKGLLRRRCEARVFSWQRASPWEKFSLELPGRARKSTQPHLRLGTVGGMGGNPAAWLVLCRMQFGQEQGCISSLIFFPLSWAELLGFFPF